MRQLLRRAIRAARGIAITTVMTVMAACGGGDGMGGGGYGGGTPPPAPSGLSYTAPPTLNVNAAMTALSPTVTGTVTAYAVSPALPAGITLNAATGVISGTPTATAAQTTYTVTASNATGNTTATVSIKVDPAIPSAYTMSALVSDGAVTAVSTDAHLKNPWGIAALAGGPAWITNNHDHTSTVYDGTGVVTTTVVTIPAGTNGPADVTGIVASSSTTDFQVTNGTVTASARFLFVSESGSLYGWAPTVNATTAIVAYNDATGAIYKGLAIATNGTANFLYAADFHNRKIDVFDKNFAKVAATGGFTDPTLPAGFAPFNIQAVTISGTTQLVVAYAKQDGTGTDELPGAGEGIVNTFDLNGTLLKHLIVRGGQLNAPWGVAVAPANFGTLSNALLIGNFGDGKINGFDASTGTFIHAIGSGGATNTAIANSGLWAIWFGNGGRNQPATTLYLAAGLNGEVNGLYARIDLGETAPDIVAPNGVAITAPAAASTVSGTVNITANAADNVGVASVKFQVRVGTTTTDISTDTSAPFSASWNSGSVANGAATLIATAFDAFGNSTASPGIAVTVSNVADVTPPTVNITTPTAGDVTGTVTVTAAATDNVGIAQVQFFAGATLIGTATTSPYQVQWNTTTLPNGIVQLTAVAKDGAGNQTTSAALAMNVILVPTLAQLQANIFTPRCSGCHTGGGGALPGSMNLSSAAATAAALINVNSVEEPTQKRVAPNAPNNSYIITKLSGVPTNGTARMPLGGPFLSQTEIDSVRAWIQAGAAP